jgi:hypothetical protein
MFFRREYDRGVTVMRGIPGASVRRIAVGLLAFGCLTILWSATTVFRNAPVPYGTPYGTLGFSGTVKLFAVLIAALSVYGFVLGGWKVALVAWGRPASPRFRVVFWFGLFGAYCLFLAASSIQRFGWHI